MLRQLCWTVVAVIGFASAAAAQTGAAGTWNGKSMIGPKDSVVTTFSMTIAPDGKSGTMTFAKRDPIPMRVLAMGGDSVVVEVGPYPSILRPGQTVKWLRTSAHIKGNMMSGTFAGEYSNGDKVQGKTDATRAK